VKITYLKAGDILRKWCSVCGHIVDRIYQPEKNPKLVCVVCHPEPNNKNAENNGI